MAGGTVVVVGGTQGLGREVAQFYADGGRDVVVTGRDQARAEAAAGEIGGSTRGVALDLAEPETIAERLADLGEVEHVVLAAIERDSNTVREYDIAAALRLVTLKLVGYTEVIHTLAPRLAPEAAVLIFGGLARDRPYPGVDDRHDGQRRSHEPRAYARDRARPDACQRDPPGDRGGQPAVARHGAGSPRRARPADADRAPRDDGGDRRRVPLPAREQGDQRHQPRRRRRLDVHVARTATVAGIALGTAVGYNIANVGAAAGVLSEEYDVRLGAIGFLTTALFVTHLVMQIPGGRLVDRRGARNLGMLALAVISLGNIVALLVPSLAVAVVGRLIAGVGTGIGFVAGSDYIRATVGSTTAQGLYGAAGVGGGGLALAIVPLTTPALDWRAPYLTALVGAVVVLACLPLAPKDRAGGERRPAAARIGEIVRDRRLYPLAIAHSASFGLSVIAGAWAVSLLQQTVTAGVLPAWSPRSRFSAAS